MPNRDYLESVVQVASHLKEQVCQDGPHDIPMQVVAYRGGQLVALITIPDSSLQTLLSVCRVAASGFDADTLAMLWESYIANPASKGINPHTGEAWGTSMDGLGAMQDVAQNHDGLTKDWVREAVSLTVVNRAGDVALRSLPYRYFMGKLAWIDDYEHVPAVAFDNDGGVDKLTGILPNSLRKIMAEASTALAFPDRPVQNWNQDDRDSLTAVYLTRRGFLVLLSSDPRNRARMGKLASIGEVMNLGDD